MSNINPSQDPHASVACCKDAGAAETGSRPFATLEELRVFLSVSLTTIKQLKNDDGIIVPAFSLGARLQRFDIEETIQRLAAASRIKDYRLTGPLVTFDILCKALSIGKTTGKKLKRAGLLRPIITIRSIIRYDLKDNLERVAKASGYKRSS